LTQNRGKSVQYILLIVVTLLLQLKQVIPQVLHPQTGFKFHDVGPIPIIQTLLQDDKGFIWFGNDGGLFRFDGYQVKSYTYSPSHSNSLSSSIVYYLFQEDEQFLWIGTSKGGTNRLDLTTDEVTRFMHDPADDSTMDSNSLWKIFRGKSGTLWFLTDVGLNKFVSKKTSNNEIAGEYFERGHSIVTLNWNDWLAKDWTQLSQEDLYFNVDAYFFDSVSEILYRLKNPSRLGGTADTDQKFIVGGDLEKDRSILWLGASPGRLIEVDLANKRARQYDLAKMIPGLKNIALKKISVERADRIWLFTHNHGAYRLNLADSSAIDYFDDESPQASLHGNTVGTFLIDQSKILWVSTEKGLNKLALRPVSFQLIQPFPKEPPGSIQNRISTLFADREGYLWIAANKRLHRLNLSKQIFEYDLQEQWHSQGFPQDVLIKTIFEDSRGDIWFGTLYHHVYRYSPSTGKISQIVLPHGSKKLVRSILEDSQGSIWFGADYPDGGAYRYNPQSGEIISYLHDPQRIDSPASNDVWKIHEDRQDRYWFTFWGGGLDMFDPHTQRYFHFQYREDDPTSISSNYVTSIVETRNDASDRNAGMLWVGTWNGGLNQLVESGSEDSLGIPDISFRRFTSQEGFVEDNQVVAMVIDDHDRLWMTTGSGITQFDPALQEFRNYTIEDGLQSEQFSAGAYAKGPTGIIYFGGTNGINAFNPDSVRRNLHIPPLVFTSFKVFEKPFPLDTLISYKKHIVLPYSANFFSIGFAALDYSEPARNQYQYLMEGFDRDWIHSGERPLAIYTNLDPGFYTFRIKGSNDDNVWNEEGASLHITILLPWYQTWWAYVIYGIFVIGFALAARWVVVNRKSILSLRARRISHYKLLELLGKGGMGEVYKAIDLNSKRVVAIKLLNPEVHSAPENRMRFAKEGKLLASFSHPNIVKVYEIGETEKLGFIAMEYLPGGTLKNHLEKKGSLPLKEAKIFLLQIAEGLKEIHSQGIIHRDIKTGNCMLDGKGDLRIMDFGLSRSPLVTTMTTLGSVIGTLGYVAPEQVTGTNVDQRVDIFSFGVVMYELLSNQLPFKGENEMALIHAIFNTVPPSPSTLREGDAPKEWDQIVYHCLEKNPSNRFSCMEEVINSIRELPV